MTGQTTLDYLKPRLFDPLGIKDPTWATSPQGISLGGYGLSIRTEDIARFGQLYLQKGKWEGKQLVPESWVDLATARQTSNGSAPTSDWDQGYGYQFWRARHNAYRGDGAFGQYCLVMPDQDTVVAINSGVKDMQAVLNVVWDHLLPALESSPLAADPAGDKQLKDRLAGLGMPTVPAGSPGELAAKVSGKRFSFPTNSRKVEAVTLTTGDSPATLTMRIDGTDQKIVCGPASWTTGRAGFGPLPEGPIAANGGWTDGDTFTAKVAFVETPFVLTLRLNYEGDALTLDTETNVGFGATKQPTLTGKAE